MSLTKNSTIIELSVHAYNFVLKILDKEGNGARVWPKLMSTLQPKIAIFLKVQYIYLPSCITSMTVYFSHQIIKISRIFVRFYY